MAPSVESAIETTKKKVDEILVEDPLTQKILDMKKEQARLKKERLSSEDS